MIRTITLLCALIALTLTLMACSSSSTPRWQELKVDDFSRQPHHMKVATAGIGDRIIVTLPSNPSTGFTWPDIAQVHDKNVLKQTEHKRVEPDSTALAGATGNEVWTFRAFKKGTTTISMGYRRPWESAGETMWTFSATITVE